MDQRVLVPLHVIYVDDDQHMNVVGLSTAEAPGHPSPPNLPPLVAVTLLQSGPVQIGQGDFFNDETWLYEEYAELFALAPQMYLILQKLAAGPTTRDTTKTLREFKELADEAARLIYQPPKG